VLSINATDKGPASDHLLTPDPDSGAPQLIVPVGHWQAARSTGAYTLLSCAASLGFQFSQFTPAPARFDIPPA
jgi:uncharacterized protein